MILRSISHAALLFCIAIMAMAPARAAGLIVVDEPVRAGGLWCLPQADDPLQFRYLPEEARIARDKDGAPLFSLTYYNAPNEDADDASSVGRAGGGALLTMIVEYRTPPSTVRRAATALKELVDPDAVLAGPVVFDSGFYDVVSSTAAGARIGFSSGNAPVLENGRVAISLQFDPEAAAVLDAALQAATPDLSVVFDMLYSGVRASYQADIVVDWDKARSSLDRGLSAGVSVYGVSVGGDIEEAVNTMMADGAITVDVKGEDANMDAIVTHIQEMATKLFFTPLEDTDASADDFGDFSNVGGVDANAGRSANRYFSINAKVKYKRKEIATTGTTRISLNKSGPATRRWSIVFNAGEVSANLRDDPAYVRTVDLTDSANVERKIDIAIDAGLRSTFAELVDLVTVELRKQHADDRETFRQHTINAEGLDDDAPPPVLRYPRFRREPWEGWLEYDVRYLWSLKGRDSFETPWKRQRSSQIIVSVPYRKVLIQPLGDMAALAEKGVLAVVIEVEAPDTPLKRATAVTSADGFAPFEIVAPRDDVEFAYRVTHIYQGDRRATCESSDRGGFVVFDVTECEEQNTD